MGVQIWGWAATARSFASKSNVFGLCCWCSHIFDIFSPATSCDSREYHVKSHDMTGGSVWHIPSLRPSLASPCWAIGHFAFNKSLSMQCTNCQYFRLENPARFPLRLLWKMFLLTKQWMHHPCQILCRSPVPIASSKLCSCSPDARIARMVTGGEIGRSACPTMLIAAAALRQDSWDT